MRSLVNDGVLEVTLLGQTVNAYGVSFADPALPRTRGAFAELLRACGDIDGLERVRFTSPPPAAFPDDVLAAMAETRTVMPRAAHAPAVRFRRGSASDAPLLSSRAFHGHPRACARSYPARRHHDGYHRRLPGGDRRGLPGNS